MTTSTIHDKPKIAAIYTTYHPDNGFRHRINAVVQYCAITIVVDNTPGGHFFTQSDANGLTILQDGVNKGLGTALNAGLAEAKRQQCEIVVLFDQDSSPEEDFIEKLCEGLYAAGPRSIVGPILLDDNDLPLAAVSTSVSSPVLQLAKCIPTSGMCFSLDCIETSDRFTEDFFLDFVDFDWCWRLQQKDWSVFRLLSLPMPHRLGLAQRHLLFLTFHIPAPYRHYFQFRDTLKMLGRSYVPIRSQIRFSVILIPKLIVYPFILDRGIERLKWMFFGIRDAFLNVGGIGAAAIKLQVLPTLAE